MSYKVSMVSLGCPKNQVDAEAMAAPRQKPMQLSLTPAVLLKMQRAKPLKIYLMPPRLKKTAQLKRLL